ncbi:hypothetical protein COY87_01205 [Candidatus Roizmanbacteria bacterium CG_4_10_14_0_8_um_filter_33_9]|uniref:Uncharacterized protein n=1 Tax=Candidatus Roizmanbacteria bacterium CG_4_10_14_0_8_um_filter_33_9 TaxID=1974826 RepID=A0A2M7QKE0_9BACT|nr:MAG: hypothetical protein COY87_01205 [Candidatus Roizmanbacteria bacterium CG_4_10_14_0_8_um_filter_33_9]
MRKKISNQIIRIKKMLKKVKRPVLYTIGFCVFTAIQLVFSPIALKIDLSEGHAYSLTPSTKKILQKINKPLTLKLFVTSDLPTRLIPIKSDVIDLLNEYRKEGNNKIQIVSVDPKKDEKIGLEAQDIGIQELQFSQLDKDKYQVATAYLGLGIYYNDKKMSIPQLTDLSNLEYNLSSVILKLTKQEMPKIGIIGDDQLATGQNDPYLTIGSILFNQYNITPLKKDTTAEKEIDPVYNALIVFDNRTTKYSDDEVTSLKKYVSNGGKLLVLADGIWITENLSTETANHNLFSLFSDWGIKLENNLVLSTSAELINFGNAGQSFLSLYPFWFQTNNFYSKAGPLSNIESLTFPWGSSLSLTKKPGITSTILVQSPPLSWVQKEPFKLNPQEIPQPTKKELQSYPLVVQLQNKKNGELIIIPSSRFVEDKFLTQSGGNVEFVFNLIDNLVSGGALSGIRSRSVVFHPLPQIDDNQKDMFKYSMMFILPGLFGIYGIWRLMKRG